MAGFTYSATSPTSLQKLLEPHILPLLSITAERWLALLPCEEENLLDILLNILSFQDTWHPTSILKNIVPKQIRTKLEQLQGSPSWSNEYIPTSSSYKQSDSETAQIICITLLYTDYLGSNTR